MLMKCTEHEDIILVWDGAQWWITCLVCVGPWVQISTKTKTKQNPTILNMQVSSANIHCVVHLS